MRQIHEEIIDALSAASGGLSSPALRQRLSRRLSQPTLSRLLRVLRARGLVTVDGRARATRYHAVTRGELPALRSRRLHERVASRLLRDPALRASAAERLVMLREVNPHGQVYHDRWAELLSGPLPNLLRMMTERSDLGDAMRKESPFTTLVSAGERREVFDRLRVA